jgi:hypothetical protein
MTATATALHNPTGEIEFELAGRLSQAWLNELLPEIAVTTPELEFELSGTSAASTLEFLTTVKAPGDSLSLQHAGLAASAVIALPLTTTVKVGNDSMQLSLPPLNVQLAQGSTQGTLTVASTGTPFTCGSQSCLGSAQASLELRALQDETALDAQAAGITSVQWDEAGWRLYDGSLSAQNITINRDSSSLTLSAAVDELSLDLAGAMHATSNFRLSLDQAEGFPLPARPRQLEITGQLNLIEQDIETEMQLSLGGRPALRVTANHAIQSQQGTARWTVPAITLTESTPLSRLVDFGPLTLDVVAGQLSGNGMLSWELGEQGPALQGPAQLTLENLAGFYGESGFVGLNTVIAATLLSPDTLRSDGMLSASIDTLDIGLPLRNSSWRYGFDTAKGLFELEALRSSLLGGYLELPSFRFDTGAPENRLDLVLVELDIDEVAALAETPGLEIDGQLSGYLPIRLGENGIRIDAGMVSALQPGGHIVYRSQGGATGNGSLDVVNQALSNYFFETLDSEVNYNDSGDLTMGLQLRGSNPDMNGGQRINLNVNLVNNIPDMLRSLQATRTITDVIERRLARPQ